MDTQPEKQSQSFTKTLMIGVFALILVSAVGYGGYRLWQNRESTTQPNNKTPTSSANPYLYNQVYGQKTADPNWYLLTDPIYHYTLEFPATWKVDDQIKKSDDNKTINQMISFLPPSEQMVNNSNSSFEIVVLDNRESISLRDWYDKYDFDHKESSGTSITVFDAKIAGEEAIFYIISNPIYVQSGPGVVVLIPNEDKVFKLRYYGYYNETDIKIFLRMLNTFEFNGQMTDDQIPEVNWQILNPEG